MTVEPPNLITKNIETPRHIAILGKKGTCKSTLMGFFVKLLEHNNPEMNIYSNMDIYAGDIFKQKEPDKNSKDEPILSPNFHRVRKFSTLLQAKNGICALDDAINMLPARRHSTDYNLSMGLLASKIRKKKLGLIYTDQYVKGVELFIRNNVDEVCKPLGKPRDPDSDFLNYVIFENNDPNFSDYASGITPFTPRLDTQPVECSRIWAFFDSFQIQEATYNTPFRLATYASGFQKWCGKKNIALARFTIGSGGLSAYLNYFEEERKRPLSQSQRGAVKAWLDSNGLLKRNEE